MPISYFDVNANHKKARRDMKKGKISQIIYGSSSIMDIDERQIKEGEKKDDKCHPRKMSKLPS